MWTLLLASQVTGLNDPGAWIQSLWVKKEEEDDASSPPRSIQGLGQMAGDTRACSWACPWAAPSHSHLAPRPGGDALPLDNSEVLTGQPRPSAGFAIFLCCLMFDFWWFANKSRTE